MTLTLVGTPDPEEPDPQTPARQAPCDTHSVFRAQDPTPTTAINDASTARHASSRSADLASPAVAHHRLAPMVAAPLLADPLLALAADVVDDLERVRTANENRLRQLTRDAVDSDGEERGFGLPLDHPDVARLSALVRGMADAEHDAVLSLQRAVRRHPLGPWIAQTTGVGEKQAARLLAAIGDPYWHVREERPRLVSELWSYCGFGDAGVQVRRRGSTVTWSGNARKRTWLIIDSSIQTLRKPCARPDGQDWADHAADCRCGPYRLIYDQGRQQYAGSPHPAECVRCGPSGSPALAGSPRSAAHLKAMSMRLAAKALLADLWREARSLHENGLAA